MHLLISKTQGVWGINLFQFCFLCYWISSMCFCAFKALKVGGGWSNAKSCACSVLSAAENKRGALWNLLLGTSLFGFYCCLYWTYDFWVLFRNAKWVLNYKGVYCCIFTNTYHGVCGNLYTLWVRHNCIIGALP